MEREDAYIYSISLPRLPSLTQGKVAPRLGEETDGLLIALIRLSASRTRHLSLCKERESGNVVVLLRRQFINDLVIFYATKHKQKFEVEYDSLDCRHYFIGSDCVAGF